MNLGGRFKRGVSILAQMSASWLNEVGARVSHILGCNFISVTIPDCVSASTPIRIGVDLDRLDSAVGGLGYTKSSYGMGSRPSDIRDPAVGEADKTPVTWNAGGPNGLKMSAYVLCEKSGSASYWYKADLDISSDGRIKRVSFDGTYRSL